jgi:hypothetical protein
MDYELTCIYGPAPTNYINNAQCYISTEVNYFEEITYLIPEYKALAKKKKTLRS